MSFKYEPNCYFKKKKKNAWLGVRWMEQCKILHIILKTFQNDKIVSLDEIMPCDINEQVAKRGRVEEQ